MYRNALRRARAGPRSTGGGPKVFSGADAVPAVPTRAPGGAGEKIPCECECVSLCVACGLAVSDVTCTARAVAVAAAPRGRLGVTGHLSRPLSALY